MGGGTINRNDKKYKSDIYPGGILAEGALGYFKEKWHEAD